MYKLSMRVFLVTTCVMLVVTSCGTSNSKAPTPTPLPPMVSYDKSIFTVERGPIAEEKDVLGEIVPSKQDDLFFRASGYVTRVTVKEGDTVKQGDLLAELQVGDLLNQLQQARIDLEVAQATLAKDESQRQYDIARAQINVTIWEKKIELAKLDVQNAIGVEARLKAQLDLDITEQNLALAQLDLQKANEQINVYEQQAVERSKLAVERLDSLINEQRIFAPYDCIVLRSRLRPGQSIDAYAIGFTVGDPSNLVVRASLDYEIRDKVKKDSEVHFAFSTDTPISYTIQYLPNFLPVSASQEAGGGQTISGDWFYFTLPTDLPKEDLEVGRQAFLTLVLGRKKDALLLPPAAIRNYRGLYFVIVLDGDRRRRVEIYQIGLKTADRWEIIADLNEGDQVLGP